MGSRVPWRAGVLALLCASWCPDAAAQLVHSASAADEAFRQGREAVKRGDYDGAYALFFKSYQLDPTPGSLFNLADCELHLGKLVEALEHFNSASRGMATGDERLALVAERVKVVNGRLPHVSIPRIASAASETVMLDGRLLFSRSQDGTTSGQPFETPVRIDPGPHSARWVVAFTNGVIDRTTSFEVAEGENKDLAIPPEIVTREQQLEAQAAAAAERATVPAPASANPTPEVALADVRTPAEERLSASAAARAASRPGRIGGAIGMVMGFGIPGAIGLILGTAWGIQVLNDKSTVSQHCRGDSCDQTGLDAASYGKTESIASPIALAVGAGFCAIGIYGAYAFLKEPSGTAIAVRPLVGGAGLTLTRGF